jgi:hypothetical protein
VRFMEARRRVDSSSAVGVALVSITATRPRRGRIEQGNSGFRSSATTRAAFLV